MLNRMQTRSTDRSAVALAVLTAIAALLPSSCGGPQQHVPHKTRAIESYDRERIHALAEKGQVADAIVQAEKALAATEQEVDDERTEALRVLISHDLGTFYFLAGDYAKSRSHLERALDTVRAYKWEHRGGTWQITMCLAKVYSFLGKIDKAESLYADTLKTLDARAEIPDASRAVVLSDYADLCVVKGDIDQAEDLLKRAVGVLEKEPERNMISLVAARLRLAGAFRVTARYDEALDLCSESLRLVQSANHTDLRRVADILAIRGVLLGEIGQLAQAKQDLARCLKLQEEDFGPRHPEVVTTVAALAALSRASGDYSEAERYYDRALEIAETAYDDKNPALALLLGNMGVLYQKMGNREKALSHFQRSYDISSDALGYGNWFTGLQAHNVAVLLHEAGQLEEAEILLLEAWDATRKACGPESPRTAIVLGTLARLYEEMGRTEEAGQLCKRSLAIRSDRLGTKDPLAVGGLNNLAVFYMRKGDLEEAENILDLALRVAERTSGDDHPSLTNVLTNVIAFERLRGEPDGAAEAADRARRIVRHHLPTVVSSLSVREQVLFQQSNDYPSWDAALSLALAHPKNESIARQSAEWVLNGKGVRGEVLAREARLVARTKDPAIAEIVGQRRNVERTLASVVLDGPEGGDASNYRSRLAALEDQQRELARRLAMEAGGFVDAGSWTTLESVQDCLTEDVVLIEVVRVSPVPLHPGRVERSLASRFVAWLITDDVSTPPKIVDLGEASRIEGAIRDVRMSLQTAHADIETKGERPAEAELRDKIKRLSDLVITPLAGQLADKPVWLISPDGALWLVPWEMLLLDGRYVVEDHELNYLISGRQLPDRPDSREPSVPMVVADPDFDAHFDEERNADETMTGTPAPVQRAETIDWKTLRSVKWPRLPGTRDEARRVIRSLSQYAKEQKVLALLGKDAREGDFKRLVNRPRVLVVGTHGLFVPADPRNENVASNGTPDQDRGIGGVLIERAELDGGGEADVLTILANNPLLQCGLVLAGANTRHSSKEADEEDGILTGLEAAALDLAGTELVILSACDTGLGEVRVGGGVASLRQSLLTAGSENVIATLWKIPDRETADLISCLVEGFSAGQPVGKALRSAQLEIIAKHRKDHGAAHPLFWASFTRTGHWRYPNRFEYREGPGGVWHFEERWPNGSPKVRCEMTLAEHGSLMRHGKYSRWHRNGVKKTDGEFVAGDREGTWVEWHDNGVKASENIYKNGALSGPFSEWNSQGETILQGQYEDDEWSGKIVMWDEETGERVESEFKNGIQHGLMVVYDKDGVKFGEAQYKEDLENGTRTLWNDDGEIFLEEEYSDGILIESRSPEEE